VEGVHQQPVLLHKDLFRFLVICTTLKPIFLGYVPYNLVH
jgi:hypothetical protein